MYDKTNRFNTEMIFFLMRLSPIHLLIQHENDQKKNKIKVEYKDDICKTYVVTSVTTLPYDKKVTVTNGFFTASYSKKQRTKNEDE